MFCPVDVTGCELHSLFRRKPEMEGMPLNQMTWPAPRGATPALELVNKISKFAGRQCCVEGACGWICSDVESVAWGTAPSGLSHWRGHCTGTDWLSWCTSNVFFRESSSEGFHGAPSPAQGSSHEGFSTETSGHWLWPVIGPIQGLAVRCPLRSADTLDLLDPW